MGGVLKDVKRRDRKIWTPIEIAEGHFQNIKKRTRKDKI